MNLNLKEIIQNLDGHIGMVTTARDLLVRALAVETAVSVPIVQTHERDQTRKAEGEANEKGFQKRQRQVRATKKANGGGRSAMSKVPSPKPKAIETKPPAAQPGNSLTERPQTMAGAMKAEIARLQSFTLEQLQTVVNEKYGAEEFYQKTSANTFYANLTYWADSGKLQKTGSGAVAEFKVVKPEFFGNVEFVS